MMRHSSRVRADSGFTLVEMLVAVTLFGLLSLVLFEALHFGHRVWEASVTVAATNNRIRAFREDVSRALSRAYPELEAATQPDRNAEVAFDGERTRVTFLTPSALRAGALERTTITADDSTGGTRLIEQNALELARNPAPIRTDPRLPAVSSVHFSYFGPEESGDDPSWHDSWAAKPAMPELIRLSIVFADHRYAWPDLVIAPKITADVSCNFDLLARACVGH